MEDASGLRFARRGVVAGFVTEECILERNVEIGWIDADRLAELLAGGLGFACFQKGVGEVLADVGTLGGDVDSLLEATDGRVVVFGTQGGERFVQRLPCGIRHLCEHCRSAQEERRESNGLFLGI